MTVLQRPICIVGPTASGKTAVSVALARRFNGEILSADSMQIYRGLTVATAAPTQAEMQGIPHWMIGTVSPAEEFSVERYVQEALPILRDIQARGKTPFVVGGAGLYINALVNGREHAPMPEDRALRRELEAFAREQGNGALHARLAQVDPESAAAIHPNNVKRVIRALEVYHLTGKTISAFNRRTQSLPPLFDPLMVGICPEPRAYLYDRIDKRVDVMFADGLVEEVRTLSQSGLPLSQTASQAIGYKELVPMLEGEMTLRQAADLIRQRSRNYAKRQLTWFRNDPRVRFFTYHEDTAFSAFVDTVADWLTENGYIDKKTQEA